MPDPKIRLLNVYREKQAEKLLYELMKGREKIVNISHRRLPSWSEHLRFVRSHPYRAWYLITDGERDGAIAGAAYLSKMNEIGVFLFKPFRGRGLGEAAVRALMAKHRDVPRFLANINPKNLRSIEFFREMGFRHIQNTYELFTTQK